MAKNKTIVTCTYILFAPLSLGLISTAIPTAARAQPRTENAVEGGTVGIEVPIETPPEEVIDGGRSVATPVAADLPLEEPLDPDGYLCGSGDSFELRFWGKQNLSIRVTADFEGNTFIPKVGKVRVAGKTLTQARALVLAAVRRYYPGLRTDLSLVKPREFIVHVVGDVNKPGMYRSNPRQRASAIVAVAGGATGSIRRIQIGRRDGSTLSADLLLYARSGDTRHNPFLLDGDVVRVPRPGPEVAIAGPVRYPGRYELVATRNLAELLELAGGLKSSASRSLPIRVTRRDRRERKTFLKISFARGGRAPDFALRDDDEVVVPSTGELERSVVLIGAVVGADPADPATTVKRLPYVQGDTVRSLIERAGGVTAAADLRSSYVRRDGEQLRPIDLDAILIRRDFRKDRAVQIGDTIVVPFKRSSVMVEGAVVRAGNFQFTPRFGVREYVASAGGTTRYARDAEEIRVVGADGKMRSFSDSLVVRPGDTIVVPERNFSRSEVVQLVMSGAGLILSAAALTYAVSR